MDLLLHVLWVALTNLRMLLFKNKIKKETIDLLLIMSGDVCTFTC